MRFKLLREGVEKDSLGNVLTPEQSRYFARSKVRDEHDRLLVCYHGTPKEFDTFDKEKIGSRWKFLSGEEYKPLYTLGFYFTDDEDYASTVGPDGIPNTVKECYLNMVNPLIINEHGWGGAVHYADMCHSDLKRWSKGHDGIIINHTEGDFFDRVIVAFEPEQIKLITNKTPTNSNKMNEDADGDDDLLMSNFIDNLTSKYTSMTSEQMLSFLNAPQRDSLDVDSPMFILPNGKIISVSDVLKANKVDFELTHNAVCECFMWLLMNNLDYSQDEIEYLSDYEWKLEPYEYKILDVLTYKFNWARINCGRTWSESRFYCVLPDTMTPSQYRTLEEWIEWGEDSGRKNVLIFATKRTENYTYSLVDNMPEEIIRNIKRYYSSGNFYESRIVNKPVNKKLTESLQRLAPNAFITDSPYQIRDLLINKPKLYRILYDSNIDMYMIGDGQEVIHWDLIRAARRLGYYAEMESFIDELGDLDNYVEFGGGGQFLDDEEIESYLIYMVFSPDDEEFILGEDGYQFQYQLPFGYMFTRDSYLEDCDLYRVVKANQSLTEGKKDFSHLYPSVQEVQNYIDNNYSVDTLPPTGATFLMPNGLFIDLGASHMTVHQEFDEQVYNDLVEDGDYVGEFRYTDLFLPRLGFIRCNDGTTMGSLLVHLPSQKPTREQYEALEGWLDASLSMDMYNYIIIATDKSTKRYDTGDYMTDELIALIKRYYASGRLYEEDEREDNSQNTPNKAETSDEEPDIIDKAQEIKDNIKASFTESS